MSSSSSSSSASSSTAAGSSSSPSSSADTEVDILGGLDDEEYEADVDVDILGLDEDEYAAEPPSSAYVEVDLGDKDAYAAGPSSSSKAEEPDKLKLDICGGDERDYAAGSSASGTRTNGVGSFGNACLDLFLLDADAPPERLRDLLAAAWDQDALTALKLVCHRRTVKRDKKGFLAAATWMLETHPRVFVDNLPVFAELGYVQDLADLLDDLVFALDERRREREREATPEDLANLLRDIPVAQDQTQREAAPEDEATLVNLQPAPAGLKRARDDDSHDPAHHAPAGLKRARGDDPAHDAPATTSPPCSSVPAVPKRARHEDPGPGAGAGAGPSAALLAAADPAPIDPEAAATEDLAPFNTLYRAIEVFLADRLRSDMGHLEKVNTPMISHAAHWCSNMTSTYELTATLRTDVARRLFPDDDPRLLTFHLHTRVLHPLVSALNHQAPERLNVRQPTLPHLIADGFGREVWRNKSSEEREEIKDEWRALVGDLRAKGSLRNCIAVCDVSGLSQETQLLNVCVALGLLTAELNEHPWKDIVHAFSEGEGRYSLTEEKTYHDRVEAIRRLNCDGRFNLKKVFNKVLQNASLVKPKDMVRTIWVLTSKPFEQAIVLPIHHLRSEHMAHENFNPEDVRRWCDEYRIICEKFEEKGLGDRVPGVVFWNLRGERSAGLTLSTDVHEGILSLSGYSDTLLRLFLKNGGVVHPEDEMKDAITGEKYEQLEVKDY